MNNGMCENCGVCCKLIPVNLNERVILRDGFQPLDEEFEESLIPLSKLQAQNINEEYVKKVQKLFPDVQFFSCKYISDFNLCTLENKPQICKDFPSSPFAFIPEDCGYLGIVFMKNEEIKQKVRKIKEEIIHYESLLKTTKDKHEKLHYQKTIMYHQKSLKKYIPFGGRNW